MEEVLHMLIKVGEYEHIESLQKEGLMYLNPVKYFQDLPNDNSVRSDEDENLTRLMQADDCVLSLNGKSIDLAKGSQIKFYEKIVDEHPSSHLFCMSSLFEGDILPEPHIFSPRIREFSTSVRGAMLVIIDSKAFLSRISDSLSDESGFSYRRVRYLDRTSYSGSMTIFDKFEEYSWQKEFRICFRFSSRLRGACALNIGSIEDISEIVDLNNFKNICDSQKNLIEF